MFIIMFIIIGISDILMFSMSDHFHSEDSCELQELYSPQPSMLAQRKP